MSELPLPNWKKLRPRWRATVRYGRGKAEDFGEFDTREEALGVARSEAETFPAGADARGVAVEIEGP